MTNNIPEQKKSIKAPIIFGVFLVFVIYLMITFYTILNNQEVMIKAILATNDTKIRELQQKKNKLQAQTTDLQNIVLQENAKYTQLQGDARNLKIVPPTNTPPVTTTPLITPRPVRRPNPVITPTPVVIQPQPVYMPPRTTRAS